VTTCLYDSLPKLWNCAPQIQNKRRGSHQLCNPVLELSKKLAGHGEPRGQFNRTLGEITGTAPRPLFGCHCERQKAPSLGKFLDSLFRTLQALQVGELQGLMIVTIGGPPTSSPPALQLVAGFPFFDTRNPRSRFPRQRRSPKRRALPFKVKLRTTDSGSEKKKKGERKKKNVRRLSSFHFILHFREAFIYAESPRCKFHNA